MYLTQSFPQWPAKLALCALLLPLAAVSAQEEKEASEKATMEKATVAEIVLKGGLPEATTAPGLFGELDEDLARMLNRLRLAERDDKISAVILDIRNPSLGRARIAQLRDAIARIRKSGKKVYARLNSAMTSDYLVAAACDEVSMPESGMVLVPGVRAEVMFYKGLFDKLGIKGDFLQMGDFKGAAEPYTRTSMSPEFRKQFEAVIDDFYNQLAESIAKDRGLKPGEVKKLIDTGLFTAKAAKEAGLIDSIAYEDEFRGGLQSKLEVEEVAYSKDYGKKKIDADFSGMLGMVRLLELLAGVDPGTRRSSNKKIAVVYGVGPIVTSGSADMFGGATMSAYSINKALKKAAEDDTVVAIVFRIDSPGGSALASDLIWREVSQIEKPVIASMGDTAASGGYYVAVGCDKIYADPGTLTGSIGVVGGKIAMGGLFNLAGLKTEVISRGENSGIFSGEQPFTETEKTAMRKMMKETYDQFLDRVSKGRNMPVEKLKPLAGGRIWTGRQAKKAGLVDELGSLRDAIIAAKKAGGMEEDEQAELLILPKPKSFFDQLIEGDSTASPVGQAATKLLPRDVQGELQLLQQLKTEPTLLWQPYRVRIR